MPPPESYCAECTHSVQPLRWQSLIDWINRTLRDAVARSAVDCAAYMKNVKTTKDAQPIASTVRRVRGGRGVDGAARQAGRRR